MTGTISFNQFINQLEYQKVGTELNNQVRDDGARRHSTPRTLEGKTLRITGAFLRVNPDVRLGRPRVDRGVVP